MLSKHSFTKLAIGSSALLVIGMTLSSCESDKSETQALNLPSKTWDRTVLTLQAQNQGAERTSPGQIVSKEQVQVASRMMGYITSLKVQEGDWVQAGQVLLQIDPLDVDGHVALAKSGGQQAEAALADAQNDFERIDRLYRDSMIPKAQWEKMKLRYEISKMQVQGAQAGLKMAKDQSRYTQVLAPISGVIRAKYAQVGNLAIPGHPILIVENPKSLEVQTQVPEDLASHLKVGSKACLRLSSQTICGAQITHKVPTADPMSHTHHLKLALPTGEWTSGHFVEVVFANEQESSLQVPASAVIERAGIRGVFVVDSQNTAQFRMIRAVRKGTDQGPWEIQAGLNSGERIITSDLLEIQSGDRINMKSSTQEVQK